MTKAIVTKSKKNDLDFTVKVLKDGLAPQIFNNTPIIDCLIAVKCSEDEIKNCEIIHED
jgi:hypothetical protein